MATINGNVCNQYVHMDLIVSETSTNTDKNTSAISWKLVGWLGTTDAAYWYSNSYHAITVKINGATVYSRANTTSSLISIGTANTQNSPVTIASGTTTVAHNADGTKTCACSFSCAYRYNAAFTWAGSGNVALTTIPRQSSISSITSSVSVNGTNAVTVAISRASSSFTHTVVFSFGSYSKTTTGVATSTSYAIPVSWLNALPDATSGTATCKVTTYSGSTKIGSTVSKTFKITVPSSVVPSISAIACSDTTGNLAKYGSYVQNKSKAKVAATASGIYSSTITSYKIVLNGATYTENNCTSGVLKTSGSNTVSVTVTDSRGRSATKTASISVLAYLSPVISAFSAVRCDSSGTANEQGGYMKLNCSASITALNNKNGKTYKVDYKKSSATTWTNAKTTSSGYSYTDTVIIPADVNYSYNVRLVVTDDFSETIATNNITTAAVILDFNESGKGVGIGQVSTKDRLQIAYDTDVNGDLYMAPETDDEKNIIFKNTGSGAYSHNCKMFGAKGTASAAIGFWDSGSAEAVFIYRDDIKQLYGNAIFKNHFLTGTIASDLTLSTTNATKVTLSAYSRQDNAGIISISNGGILCGRDGYVLVSGSVGYSAIGTAGGIFMAYIYNNSVIVSQSSDRITGSYQTIPLASKVIPVSAGDLIYLYARNQNVAGSTVHNNGVATYLNVMYVA